MQPTLQRLRLNNANEEKLLRSPAIPFIPPPLSDFDFGGAGNEIANDANGDENLNRSSEKENREEPTTTTKKKTPTTTQKPSYDKLTAKQKRIAQLKDELAKIVGSDEDEESSRAQPKVAEKGQNKVRSKPDEEVDDDDGDLDFNESMTEKRKRHTDKENRLKPIENTPRKKTARNLSRFNDLDSNSDSDPNNEKVFDFVVNKNSRVKQPSKTNETATTSVKADAPSAKKTTVVDVTSPPVLSKKTTAVKQSSTSKHFAKPGGVSSSKENVAKTSAAAIDENIDEDDDDDDDDDDRGREVKPYMFKGRTPWTADETVYLVMGVMMYGKGAWASILDRFKRHFKDRSNVHLKDKYRNLERHPEELKMMERKADIRIKNRANKESKDNDE
jgi:hypothetical protein